MTLEEKASSIFGLDKKTIEKLDTTIEEKNSLLVMQIHIDMNKYKNQLSSYSEILKEYFGKDKIYVLSKIKDRKGIGAMFANFFQNSKDKVMNEMKSFSPSYLVKKKNSSILVTQSGEYLTIYELPESCESPFVFNGYRYKEANEIKLK